MALYGVVYAVLANDIRELPARHIILQVGDMVAGAGGDAVRRREQLGPRHGRGVSPVGRDADRRLLRQSDDRDDKKPISRQTRPRAVFTHPTH